MFNLTRSERAIIVFLISTLLLLISLILYKRLQPPIKVEIGKFQIEYEDTKERIDINEADVEELMMLEGVGKVLARRIVDYRNQNGRFYSIEDIRNVKGIGESMFEKFKDDISVE